jgi:uncharacterized membrane protein
MIRFWRTVALSGYFGLFGLLLLWFAWLEPPSRLPVAWALLLWVGPLLFPVRGLLHSRPYTHAWASFLALFYFGWCPSVYVMSLIIQCRERMLDGIQGIQQ